jgi:hypothetical protein
MREKVTAGKLYAQHPPDVLVELENSNMIQYPRRVLDLRCDDRNNILD